MSGFFQKFVHAAVGGSFCALLTCAAAKPAPLQLRIAIVTDSAGQDALLGARMSILEAQRAAQLLGAQVTATELPLAKDLLSRIESDSIDAIVVAGDSALVSSLAVTGVAVLSVQPAQPAPNVFQLLSGCEVWKDTLDPFGAAQLNARYVAAYHRPMTSQAWAGWLAIKILWESAARARSGAPADISAFLASARAAFDGHRGSLLRFDGVTHILQVPCL